jgi:predicted RNase H-like nuclease (RuvC/YqgF family)
MGLFRRATPMDPAEIERLKAEISSLREALEHHDASARLLHDKLTTLDDRVTAVSTELANQLTELGKDIDALGARPPGEPVDAETLAAVREGQVRLANEQARYQIAFREDLARLAHELKRTR